MITAKNGVDKAQGGFTLLEIMVSMLLFLVLSAGMASAYIAHLKHNTDSEIRSGAVAAAQGRLDLLRLEDPADLPLTGDETDYTTIDGRNFEVITSFCTIPSYCVSGNSRHLLVKINYLGRERYVTETVYTRLQ